MKSCKAITFLFSLLAIASCTAAPDLQSRLETARLQAGGTFQETVLQTTRFDLYALLKPADNSALLTVFIEGDGYAWASRRRASSDPTPITQTVLGLAQAYSSANIAYLARPCQFIGSESRNCDPSLWTKARYSGAVVAALDEALTILKEKYAAKQLQLIGYSGGGTLAALLAAKRTDVDSYITVAAPLDTLAFTTHHAVTPMSSSLNPVDYAENLAAIPQVHLVGADDEIVPEQISLNFLHSLPTRRCTEIRVVPDADHWTGWQTMRPPLNKIVATCDREQ
jgi:pimeloyl-ACP methyl ester carboxylesterase